jgi:hypothetical protein
MPPKLTPDFIAVTITGLEEQNKRIDAHITELKDVLGGHTRWFPCEEGCRPRGPTKETPFLSSGPVQDGRGTEEKVDSSEE